VLNSLFNWSWAEPIATLVRMLAGGAPMVDSGEWTQSVETGTGREAKTDILSIFQNAGIASSALRDDRDGGHSTTKVGALYHG